jgi:hypothetical protein
VDVGGRRVCSGVYRWMSGHKEGWGVPLVMLALVLLPLMDVVWLPPDQYLGGELVGSDFSFAMLPWWQFIADSLERGELPLWNPSVSSGLPFFANPQPALFYPPVWLINVLPPTRVLGLLFVLHLWLAGWGMYVWLRSEGASQRGAWFGAVAFAFGGYFLVRVSAGHSDVLMTQVWLPWMLWGCRRAMVRHQNGASVRAMVRHQNGASVRMTGCKQVACDQVAKVDWPRIVLGGVPVGLSLLAGHTATFFYVGVVLGTYALYFAWLDRETRADADVRSGNAWFPGFLKTLLPVVGMGVVGLALAAVQLVPTFQFLSLSTRQDAGYAFASQYALPPTYWLTLLVPSFFGDMVNTGYWGDGIYWELIYYVGILPLALVLMGGARLPHRLRPWLLVLAVAGLLLALGGSTIVHRLAYTLIPLFSAARAAARGGFLFTFAIAVLGGLLITWVESRPADAFPGDRQWSVAAWVVGVIAALVVLTSVILFTLQRDSNPEVGRLWHVANYTSLFLLFFLLTVALLAGWKNGRFTGAQGAVLAIGLVFLDLWSFGRPLLRAVPVPACDFWQNVADSVDSTQGRVLPWGLTMFEQNLGLPLGVESVFSYDPMGIGRYDRFISYVADPRARAYDLLHACYLATENEMDFPDAPESPRLLEKRGGVWIYERPGVFPRAWLVHRAEVQADEGALLARLNDPAFDPRQAALVEQALPCSLDVPTQGAEETVRHQNGAFVEEAARITEHSNNTVALEVEAESDGLLVLSEVMYPGWRVSVDGERVPIVRTDYILRGVCVPAGTHHVTFSFCPASLIAGVIITVLAWLCVGWAALSVVRRR